MVDPSRFRRNIDFILFGEALQQQRD